MVSIPLKDSQQMPLSKVADPRKVLVYGESGTGKTFSAVTLLNAGQKIRFLAAENNAVSGIRMGIKNFKGSRTDGDFAIMIPDRQKQSISDLVKGFEKNLTIPVTTQITTADPNRKSYTRYLNILKGLGNYIDDDTGTDYGTIDQWGPDVTLVIDGLTIICEAIIQGLIGSKLGMTQPEFQGAQMILSNFIRMLTEDLACNLVLVAHPDKDVDLITGKQTIYPANIGKALNNKIPSMFTDVLWSFRKGKEFLWSTDHPIAVTRASHIGVLSEVKQDYAELFK